MIPISLDINLSSIFNLQFIDEPRPTPCPTCNGNIFTFEYKRNDTYYFKCYTCKIIPFYDDDDTRSLCYIPIKYIFI